MSLDNIPTELRERHQWTCWRSDKHPRTPTGEHASVSDPTTWCSFDDACEAVRSRRAIGVGFVFTDDDPYTAIDLDKIINDSGVIDSDAQGIIDRLDSYTEISKSGRGIHIIVRGAKPSSRCRKARVEIYDRRRYFALTGNLWQDRGSIEDRQEELEWLCSDIFGRQAESPLPDEVMPSIVLSDDAELPADKLRLLLKKSDFRRAWEHRDEELRSLSDYDWRLATIAVDSDWSDQEIANLIVSFRREHGDDDDVKKSLRADYIPRTLSKARSSRSTGTLGLLPFIVRRVLQYGMQDSEFELEVDSGPNIPMGPTESLLSPRKAEARLYEAGYETSDRMVKRWKHIVRELMPLIEKVQTITREESARGWLDDYINSRISLPNIESEDDINRLFGSGLHSIAVDRSGRVYLRLSDITRYVRVHTGLGGVSSKTVAHDLISLDFGKRKVYISEEGKRRQISLWVSPAGFIRAE